jgi:hypothetical protein
MSNGAGNCDLRILLNAEAFGFGPPAAAAMLANELSKFCAHLGYVGGGHTLDLQRIPPYHEVHDITGLSDAEQLMRLRALAARYDVLVTAMDFAMAGLARQAGLDVVIYDALSWFWPAIPAMVQEESILYIVQDFFGVRERVGAAPALREHVVIVPPAITSSGPHSWRSGQHVLVNLGGLHNPFWQINDAVRYAEIMVAAVRAAVPAGHTMVVAASRSVATMFSDPAVGMYDRASVLRLMSGAAYACMTPGLGNIYDAASTGVPTLWLPPVNQTQPRQVELLSEHGYCDARVDWSDIGRRVEYRGPAEAVVSAVARVVHDVSGNQEVQARLAACITEAVDGLEEAPGRARNLVERFGADGMRHTAEAIIKWVRQRHPDFRSW